MAKRSEHAWQDDALRPEGRAWVAGVRFVCGNGCGVERRVIHVGEKEEKASRYIVDGKLAKGGEPGCSRQTS